MNGAQEIRGEERPRRAAWLLLALLALPVVLYGGTYLYARASHRLVHYAGGFIARPNAMHGIGWTTWELVFAPAAWVEVTVRDALDPTW
jgi:hypothetical protein